MSLNITLTAIKPTQVYDTNITHNLGVMVDKLGIYKHLWRPEEINIEKAWQLIDPLTKGLETLKGDPNYYKEFNPKNGWGSYDTLVSFIEKYLDACIADPEAEISVYR